MKYVVVASYIITILTTLWCCCIISTGKVQASSRTSLQDYLLLGDQALADNEFEQAIHYYKEGINLFIVGDDSSKSSSVQVDTDDHDDELMIVIVSIYTNMATALSVIGQKNDAIEGYEKALLLFQEKSTNDTEDKKSDLTMLVAQTAFFLGMEYQDTNSFQQAIEAYQYSIQLDPNHWAALSNLGSILYDTMKNYDRALQVYNKAYNILTDPKFEPTDPPPEPRPILAQLQYRIGLCISSSSSNLAKRKCILDDDLDNKLVDCTEMASHAFSLAIDYDPDNSQAARHMLATITADATMTRASNEYVKSLFDEYATNFEHSLVQELQYDGYKRLRHGFNRAFNSINNVPIFNKVIDAGCGTGLVGEQFRNISHYLIGVDLSEAIVNEAIAARPNLYNEVITGDVIEVFYTKRPIDLIIAGDSYIYFGDLQQLFTAMSFGLINGGYVAFTLENVNIDDENTLQQSKPNWKWQLTPSGRFAHNRQYVIDIAKQNSFQLVHYEPLNDFRYEHGTGVRGHIFVLQKVSTSTATSTINDEL